MTLRLPLLQNSIAERFQLFDFNYHFEIVRITEAQMAVLAPRCRSDITDVNEMTNSGNAAELTQARIQTPPQDDSRQATVCGGVTAARGYGNSKIGQLFLLWIKCGLHQTLTPHLPDMRQRTNAAA